MYYFGYLRENDADEKSKRQYSVTLTVERLQ